MSRFHHLFTSPQRWTHCFGLFIVTSVKGFGSRPLLSNPSVRTLTLSLSLFFLYALSNLSAAASAPSATTKCQNSLVKNQKNEILGTIGLLTKRLQEQHGIEPRLHRLSDTFFLKDQNGQILGYRKYKLETPEDLTLLVTETYERYQRKGVSKLLLAYLLFEFPTVRRIHVETLVETNSDQFDRALLEGATPEKAISRTATFKMMQSFGFTQISSVSPLTGGFTAKKSPQNQRIIKSRINKPL